MSAAYRERSQRLFKENTFATCYQCMCDSADPWVIQSIADYERGGGVARAWWGPEGSYCSAYDRFKAGNLVSIARLCDR